MQNRKIVKGCFFLINIIIIVTLISACSVTKSGINTPDTGSKTDNTIEKKETSNESKSQNNKEQINELKAREVIGNFIEIVKSNDASALKKITSPSGLIVIRNFSSGNGTRGKDIRDIYAADKIPNNLQFPVKGEIPIVLNNLFKESIKNKIVEIPIEKVSGINFYFKDDSKTKVYGPPTDEVRDICSELPSSKDEKNQFSAHIYMLDNKEIVLTESALVSDSPVGVWAIFEKKDDLYFVRAIIDLR